MKTPNYRVTVLVALYKAGKFIETKLETLRQQTIFKQCDIVLLNCQNLNNERDTYSSFLKFPNVREIYYPEYKKLYSTWNDGIRSSTAHYIVNSNVDDILHPECYEKLARILDFYADYGVVMSNAYVTGRPNSLWPNWEVHHGIIETMYPLGTPGPGPMWRKYIHDKLGYFKDRYVVGDALFWEHCHQNGVKFLNTPEILMSYYQECGQNLETRIDENLGRPLRDIDLDPNLTKDTE